MITDSWFYYFSSTAQTIAAASAVLMALAVIRLQYLANALHAVEHLLEEAFFRIGKHDEYRRSAHRHSLVEDWQSYFHEVGQLANSSGSSFPSTGGFTESRVFVDSLLEQGNS